MVFLLFQSNEDIVHQTSLKTFHMAFFSAKRKKNKDGWGVMTISNIDFIWLPALSCFLVCFCLGFFKGESQGDNYNHFSRSRTQKLKNLQESWTRGSAAVTWHPLHTIIGPRFPQWTPLQCPLKWCRKGEMVPVKKLCVPSWGGHMINILRSNCTEIGNIIPCFHSSRVELLNRNIMCATLESLHFPISHLLIGLPSLSPTVF